MKNLLWMGGVVFAIAAFLVLSLPLGSLKAESEEPEGSGEGVDIETCLCPVHYSCFSAWAPDPYEDFAEADGGNNKYDRAVVYMFPNPNLGYWEDECYGIGDNRLCEYWCYDPDQDGQGNLYCQAYVCNCSDGECPSE